MNQKIGALVIDLQGFQLTAEEKELLAHPIVGGVILFSRNYDSITQLQGLCREIRASRQTPLLIMVDQEGGRVQRFRKQFYELPCLSFFGDWYDKNPTLALELANSAGWLMAAEVASAGIDFSIAPVVDLKQGSKAIGDRAFHSDPDVVYQLARSYIQGMREAGMTSVIKHFPGHGSIPEDSHHDIPVDQRELKVLLESDMQPFLQLIREGVQSVLAAHIIFPRIDRQQVSFSRVWLQDILRKQLGFEGVILSDDLNMRGADISNDYADRVTAALDAGCDFALVCNNRTGVIQVIDQLPHNKHQVNAEKWCILNADFSRLQNTEDRKELAKNFLREHVNTLRNESLTNT
ncbi:MAG TPA: beta-N-acetylhexosaminidase [Gammaproteobacteria bacterium]|jgi:beta-N-acetylhexosaminidase|nr:beta-N-acetylhexosaminidase [Gammaproteobacteria bacterium]